jgi:hypothetical protein
MMTKDQYTKREFVAYFQLENKNTREEKLNKFVHEEDSDAIHLQ